MKSLRGKTIAITRKKTDAGEFIELVKKEEGDPIALPTIEAVSVGHDAARQFLRRLRLKRHEYCAFMSAQAVDALLGAEGTDEVRKSLTGTEVIAVGPKTRARLSYFGVKTSLMPEKFSSIGLVEMFSNLRPEGRKIIIPRSAAAGDYAASELRSLGMDVDEIIVYDVMTSKPSPEWERFGKLLAGGKVDAVIFTSASSVAAFFELLLSVVPGGVDLNSVTKSISIGPFTSEELRARNVNPMEANEHTVAGAVELTKKILTS